MAEGSKADDPVLLALEKLRGELIDAIRKELNRPSKRLLSIPETACYVNLSSKTIRNKLSSGTMDYLNRKFAILQKFGCQADLAQAIGLSENTLSKIVVGRRQPSEDQARRIAEALQVPVEELFEATR